MDNKTSGGIVLGITAVLILAFIGSTILTPAKSDDILVINRGGNSTTTDCINVGNGAFVVKNTTDNCYIRSVVGSSDISVTQQSNTITIDYNGTSSGGVTSITNGTGISVNQTTGSVLVTNTAPDNTSCANVGSGSQVYKDGECNFRTIIGSSDISVTQQTNTITIDYNGTASGVTSLTSTNSAIVLNSTSGNISITPVWQLLCQDIAGAGDTSMNCSTFTTHRYYQVMIYQRIQTASANFALTIDADNNNNYSYRLSLNGGADSTTINTNNCITSGSLGNGQFGETVYTFSNNESGQEKTGYGQTTGMTTSGAGNTPFRVETSCKWANTGSNITDFDIVRISGTGTLASGYLVVYGHD